MRTEQPRIRHEQLIDSICRRISRNLPVRRKLPGGGLVNVERQMPFLCVYRGPEPAHDDGTRALLTTEASYVIAPSAPEHHPQVSLLCRRIAEVLHEHFGAFLVVEIWQAHERHRIPRSEEELLTPAFRVITEPGVLPTTAESLREALNGIQIQGRGATVTTAESEDIRPPGLVPLLPRGELDAQGCFRIGVEVKPIYADPATGARYPLLLAAVRQQFGQALKQALYAFAGYETSDPPRHFEALGRRILLRAVGSADHRLAELGEQFDFLLMVTPINARQAWEEFERRGFDWEPTWYYRPLPFDPDLAKRELFQIPLERIDDPTLAFLLRQKRDELDREITMLRDRGTRNFLYTSLQVFGSVSDGLYGLARDILDRFQPLPDPCAGEVVGAEEFRQAALAELRYYRDIYPEFEATVEVRDDVPAEVMVSRHRLLISSSFCTARRRVRPLLQHEIGTHLLTYFNGQAQPFKQLALGLAGYEPLQEGLAVLNEYLVGGLSRSRMRMLAARVLGARLLTEGAGFLDVFRELHAVRGFAPRLAFTTTVRLFRGGGLTKDAVYLRGLYELLDYLKEGHQLAPLLVGKVALEHVPYIRELRRREVIQPPAVRPRHLEDRPARQRLERARQLSVLDLIG